MNDERCLQQLAEATDFAAAPPERAPARPAPAESTVDNWRSQVRFAAAAGAGDNSLAARLPSTLQAQHRSVQQASAGSATVASSRSVGGIEVQIGAFATEQEARARLEAQWPIEEKIERAHLVIRTDAGFAETDRAVAAAYEGLRAGG